MSTGAILLEIVLAVAGTGVGVVAGGWISNRTASQQAQQTSAELREVEDGLRSATGELIEDAVAGITNALERSFYDAQERLVSRMEEDGVLTITERDEEGRAAEVEIEDAQGERRKVPVSSLYSLPATGIPEAVARIASQNPLQEYMARMAKQGGWANLAKQQSAFANLAKQSGWGSLAKQIASANRTNQWAKLAARSRPLANVKVPKSAFYSGAMKLPPGTFFPRGVPKLPPGTFPTSRPTTEEDDDEGR